jgi:quercetin dioxygenase-like cupin family protein
MTHRRALIRAGCAAIFAALRLARPLRAQQPAGTPRQLFQQDLTGPFAGWEVTAVEVSFPPGAQSGRHRHPGFVLGYVLEGSYRFQVDGGREVTLSAGQIFHEPLGSVHAVSANPSSTQPARILAVIVGEKGKTTAPA